MLEPASPSAPQKVLKFACLRALSPRQAFYQLWLVEIAGRYQVGKISGAGNRPWHQQQWEYDDLQTALAFFEQRLRQKTNPRRRSRRHYRLVPQLPPPRRRQLELDFG